MTIGIVGCSSGSGVTHLGIALSVFCSSKLRKRTAFIELHTRNEISQLVPDYIFQNPACMSQTHPHFSLHGIDFYPCASSNDIPFLLNLGYEYIIMDLGCQTEAIFSEFFRCDRKLVLGSLSSWKIRDYQKCLESFQQNVSLGEGFFYLVQSGIFKNISHFSRSWHITMHNVPFINNPFLISKEVFVFFETLLAIQRG